MNKLNTVTLDNGLKIYLYKDSRRHSTFFQFNTYCGGLTKNFRCDGESYHIQDGVSHILEHYIVECNSHGNFLDTLGKKQMSTNASTSMKITSYYFETVFDVLYGIETILNGVYNVIFDEEKLLKLKKPIYQEIRGKFDNKFYHLNRMRIDNIFNDLEYRDVGGSLEDVEKTNIDDLKILYKAFYQPKNQFIVIAGNFDEDEVINKIKEIYSKLNIEEHDVELINYDEDCSIRKKEDTLYFPTPMEYVEISFKIDVSKYSNKELLDFDFYINSFYSDYFGVTSTLYNDLVNSKVIIDNINCYDTRINNYLIISIGAYVNDKDYFINSVLNCIEKLDSFDEEKFEINKKNTAVRLILRDENIFNMIFPFIDNIVYFNYPYLDNVDDVYKLSFSEYKKYINDLDFSNYIIINIENK